MTSSQEQSSRESGFTGVSIELSEVNFENAQQQAREQNQTLEEWVDGLVRKELNREWMA
jgi:hypothetical protein